MKMRREQRRRQRLRPFLVLSMLACATASTAEQDCNIYRGAYPYNADGCFLSDGGW